MNNIIAISLFHNKYLTIDSFVNQKVQEAKRCGTNPKLTHNQCSLLQVRRYKRLTDLTIEDYALQTLDNVHPGDCIVCFSKRDIHQVTREIERRGHEVAVIYGGLQTLSYFCLSLDFYLNFIRLDIQ